MNTLTRIAAAGVAAALLAGAGAGTALASPAPAPAPVEAASQLDGADAIDIQEAQAGAWEVEGLDAEVVSSFDEFVSVDAEGVYRLEVPADRAAADPIGADIAQRAVEHANELYADAPAVRAELALGDELTSDPLPMGEHGTFTASWWGMTFTLDRHAAEELNAALASGADVTAVVGAIIKLPLSAEPLAAPIIDVIVKVVKGASEQVAANVTDDGLVIKSLWLPIVWVEKPEGPFVPAPQPEAAADAR